MSNLPIEYQPVVSRIVDAISKGIEAARLEQYLRDTGWFEVGGQEISSEVFRGLVAIALHQMTMQTGISGGAKAKRDEAYSMARSVAMSALLSGDLKNANAAVSNMAKLIEISRPQKEKAGTPTRKASLPDMSFEDIARHIIPPKIETPEPDIELPPPEQGAPDAGDL